MESGRPRCQSANSLLDDLDDIEVRSHEKRDPTIFECNGPHGAGDEFEVRGAKGRNRFVESRRFERLVVDFGAALNDCGDRRIGGKRSKQFETGAGPQQETPSHLLYGILEIGSFTSIAEIEPDAGLPIEINAGETKMMKFAFQPIKHQDCAR